MGKPGTIPNYSVAIQGRRVWRCEGEM